LGTNELITYDKKPLLKRLAQKLSVLIGNTPLQQNTELYDYLKGRYGVKKDVFGLFSYTQFGQKQLEGIRTLEVKDIHSLSGIGQLQNLTTLNCTLTSGEIDFDSYCDALDNPQLTSSMLNISDTRVLDGHDATRINPNCEFLVNNISGVEREEIAPINRRLDEIKALTNESMSDKEKAEILYRYLGNAIEYDDDAKIGNARSRGLAGTLLDGKGVCTGYAATLEAVFKDAGIEAIQIGGAGEGNANAGIGDHQWNEAKIDGQWYNFDLTFDSASDKEKFNRGEWGNFMMSDSTFLRNHTKCPDEPHHECLDETYDHERVQPEEINTAGLVRDDSKRTMSLAEHIATSGKGYDNVTMPTMNTRKTERNTISYDFER